MEHVYLVELTLNLWEDSVVLPCTNMVLFPNSAFSNLLASRKSICRSIVELMNMHSQVGCLLVHLAWELL